MLGERGYPRPQLVRNAWTSLDGRWEFAIDHGGSRRLAQVPFDLAIAVPFAPEAPASGIADTGLYAACWYRRKFEPPQLRDGERLILHFGAVDHDATVSVNGALAGAHRGGYTPFAFDITELLRGGGPQTIIVRAEDDPGDLEKPRGKQYWLREPEGIWYPRTTGIWQSVWLETLPPNAIVSLSWRADPARWAIWLRMSVDGSERDDLRLRVRLRAGDVALAEHTYALRGEREIEREIALVDHGARWREELLWSPSSPTLIDAEITLLDRAGTIVDQVMSYTAMRSVGIDGDRFMLNGRALGLRMVLDQGYWPMGGLTAPSDAEVRRDVELAKAMGFNGVRKHQKLEDPRYLYWADRLGLMVWEEMPSAQRFSPRSVALLNAEWQEAIARDRSHPCIVAWVPFNESWGVPDLATSAAQRRYVESIYHLTKALDPDRPVVANDGWECVASDILGVHDYADRPELLASRYAAANLSERLACERPAGKPLLLERAHRGEPVMLTEFGGLSVADGRAGTWGYRRVRDGAELCDHYRAVLDAVRSCSALAGFCYTQFADTYQETNGLLGEDRRPKFALAEIAAATMGDAMEPAAPTRRWVGSGRASAGDLEAAG